MCHNATINPLILTDTESPQVLVQKDRTPPEVTVPATATQPAAEQHPTNINQDKVKAAANKRKRDTQASIGSSPDASTVKAPVTQGGSQSRKATKKET